MSRVINYQLHIANKNYSSWSLRPWVLMKHLGISFDECQHIFSSEHGANRTVFRSFSPNGMVPCLHDQELRVWDSLAIVEYLAERHQGVWPVSAAARAWARSAATEMHSGFSSLRNNCPMSCGLRVQLHEISAALHMDLVRIDELWCEGLKKFGGPFLAGDTFTAVDAFFAPVAFRVQTYNLPLGEQAAAYVQRLLSLPVMREWETAALNEIWREAGHEADSLAAGELVADLRAK